MKSSYLIWSIRLGAWLSASGGTSDWKLARKFEEAAAITFCSSQSDPDGNLSAFPVPLYLIESL
jgi:hypothetical protein